MKFRSTALFIGLATSLTIGLAGCASTSQPSEAEDASVRFPDLDSTYLKTGDFVDPQNVLRITPGQHKDQVRLLLGNPHFSEGVFGVREWNYVFNLYTGEGDEYITCQYQVNYDDDMRLESARWRDAQCGLLLEPIEVEEVPVEPRVEYLTLAGDTLFDFDSDQLSSEGRRVVDELVLTIKNDFVNPDILVSGYTDRIGSEAYNLALSNSRAKTVADRMAYQGVLRSKITTVGRGMNDPVVTCPGRSATPSVIECLKPNRRVEVVVTENAQ